MKRMALLPRFAGAIASALLAPTVLFVVIVSSCAQVIIDDFNEGAFSSTASTPLSRVTVPGQHAIGGSRLVDIQDPANPTSSTASLNVSDGYLRYNRAQNGRLIVRWGATFASDVAHLDVATGGGDRFELTYSAPAALNYSFFYADNAHPDSIWQQSGSVGGSGVLQILFQPGDINYADLRFIEFDISRDSENQFGEYRLGSLIVVPEVPGYSLVTAVLVFCVGICSRIRLRLWSFRNHRKPFAAWK